ncbi:hypothetical protein D3C73_1215600 [compost metagenome]
MCESSMGRATYNIRDIRHINSVLPMKGWMDYNFVAYRYIVHTCPDLDNDSCPIRSKNEWLVLSGTSCHNKQITVVNSSGFQLDLYLALPWCLGCCC